MGKVSASVVPESDVLASVSERVGDGKREEERERPRGAERERRRYEVRGRHNSGFPSLFSLTFASTFPLSLLLSRACTANLIYETLRQKASCQELVKKGLRRRRGGRGGVKMRGEKMSAITSSLSYHPSSSGSRALPDMRGDEVCLRFDETGSLDQSRSVSTSPTRNQVFTESKWEECVMQHAMSKRKGHRPPSNHKARFRNLRS
jgi:hypothetical protein